MKLLIVEDDELMQETLRSVFSDHDLTITSSMAEALRALQTEVFSVAFLDINLRKGTEGDGIELLRTIRSGDHYLPCVMISGLSDQTTITSCLELGAVDYIVKGSGGSESYLFALSKALAWRKLFSESQTARSPVTARGKSNYEMFGKSQSLTELKEVIKKVGKLGGPFLILGETGTGKELVARNLWEAKGDSSRAFVALNCASLPENLVESELFGYERGAFTGALSMKTGLFEAANGGDIFLDEIGELSLSLQAKLLRVLQEKRVRRLGSDKERPIDFRVIAATHIDVLSAVEEGDFREDLFYRLNVHQIQVPPLRSRREDVPELFRRFMNELGAPTVELSEDIRKSLEDFSWPGNIRQLRGFCQSVLPYIVGPKYEIAQSTVSHWFRQNDVRKKGQPGSVGEGRFAIAEEVKRAQNEKKPVNVVEKLDQLQRAYVEASLHLTQGNRSAAAKILGISRQRLSNWMSEWGMG